MVISKIVVVLFALLVSSAIAAPALKALSPKDPELQVRNIKHMAEAVSIAHKIRKLKPAPNKAVFWSGRKPNKNGNLVTVKPDAERFAKDRGKFLLGETLAQHGITIPPKKTNPLSGRLWKLASKALAQKASGDTHAVLGPERRPGSVYDTIEKPALLKNAKVPTLTEHNMGTGESTVVKGPTET